VYSLWGVQHGGLFGLLAYSPTRLLAYSVLMVLFSSNKANAADQAAAQPGDLLVEGAFTWRYVGQVPPAVTRPSPEEPLRYVVDSSRAKMPAHEAFLGAKRVDTAGLWELIAVDVNKLPMAGESADEAFLLDAELEDSDEELPDGTVIEWTPLSWDTDDCNNNGSDDKFIWSGESRTTANTAFSRPRTVVRISEFAQCSGVIIRDRWILTAAHCVSDNMGQPAEEWNVTVALPWANVSVGSVELLVLAPGYDPDLGHDFNKDWALLRLASPLVTNPEAMVLSQAADSTITGLGANVHNLGFPARFPGCSLNSDTSRPLVHSADNEVTATPSEAFRWKGDASGAQSGGPLYYCPTGDDLVCAPGDLGYVLAVVGGYSSYYSRLVGPKIPYWKSIIEGVVDVNP
jgi:hypothetical protein